MRFCLFVCVCFVFAALVGGSISALIQSKVWSENVPGGLLELSGAMAETGAPAEAQEVEGEGAEEEKPTPTSHCK